MDNVFQLLKHTGTPFVFASSQMSNMLDSSYGVLKRIGEFYTQALSGITVRFWNVFGEEKHPEKFHVISDFIEMARKGHIDMHTDGLEMRQFLHGRDATAALLEVGERWHVLNPATYYDITSFRWATIRVVADIIARHYAVEVSPGALKDFTQTRRNEPTNDILEFWNPKISLEEGIEELIRLRET